MQNVIFLRVRYVMIFWVQNVTIFPDKMLLYFRTWFALYPLAPPFFFTLILSVKSPDISNIEIVFVYRFDFQFINVISSSILVRYPSPVEGYTAALMLRVLLWIR